MLWFYLFSFLLWTIGYLTSPYPFPSPFCCLCCLFIALFGWFRFAWFITLITSSCDGDREGAMEGGKLLLYCCLLCDLTGWESNTKVGGMEMGGTGPARISPLLTLLPGFLEMTDSSTPFFWAFQAERVGLSGSSMRGWPERGNSYSLDVTI